MKQTSFKEPNDSNLVPITSRHRLKKETSIEDRFMAEDRAENRAIVSF